MNKESKHTPGPWKQGNKRDGLFTIRAGYTELGNPLDTYPVANAFTEANAAFIVQACNSHAKLVDVVRSMVFLDDDSELDQAQFQKLREIAFEKARAILAEVEGK